MGLIFRKSLRVGPFRLNTSKSGEDLSAEVPVLLPGADLSSGNLTFTVIRGEVLGNFEATPSQT
jgi:hypothetical protein